MTDTTPDPAVVADCTCLVGEGPLWHPDQGVLYWTDILRGDLFRYDPATDEYEQALDYDGAIGGFTIQEDGSLLLFLDRGSVRPWNDETGLGAPTVDEIPAERESRFNDVIAGPRGRVYCGTMPTDERGGRLYRLDTDGSLSTLLEDLAIPNGLAFTRDRRQLYFTETEADRIYRFDYDQSTGELSNRDVFVDSGDERGKPDGMTVDAEGHVWSAFWNGERLVRYAPDGTPQRRVDFPARKVSSVTFAGPDYDEAYVTTALGPGDGEPGTSATEGEGAGALFRFRPGVTGIPEFQSRIRM